MGVCLSQGGSAGTRSFDRAWPCPQRIQIETSKVVEGTKEKQNITQAFFFFYCFFQARNTSSPVFAGSPASSSSSVPPPPAASAEIDCTGETGENGISVAAAWTRGKRPTMEDSHLLLPDLREELESEDGRVALFGVFDGHGGARAALLAKELLLPVLSK